VRGELSTTLQAPDRRAAQARALHDPWLPKDGLGVVTSMCGVLLVIACKYERQKATIETRRPECQSLIWVGQKLLRT
jgi:hypothetical protein